MLARYPMNASSIAAFTSVAHELLSALTLTQISLSHTDINSAGLSILADGLCKIDDNPLLVLVLDGNPLGREPQDLTQDSTRLHASSNKNSFSTASATRIAAIVKSAKGLTRLSLADCQLGNSGIVIVAEAVQVHHKIAIFNISDNEVTGTSGSDLLKASEAMGAMLLTNCKLLQLSYAMNNLNRKCGSAFFGGGGYADVGLISNKTLRTLNVAKTGCCRTQEGIELLVRLLSSSASPLETLDISSCGLTGQYMALFTEGLLASNLNLLILDGNLIQAHGDGYGVLMCRRGRKRYVLDFTEKADEKSGLPADRRLPATEVQRQFDLYSQMGAMRLTDKVRMKNLLSGLGFDWNSSEIRTVYVEMDKDNSETVDFQEFYQWCVIRMCVCA